MTTYEQIMCYGMLSSWALRFGKANAWIVQACGHDAGVVLNALIDLHMESPHTEYFEVSVDILERKTYLSKYKQANALKELSRVGITTVTAKGKSKRRFVALHFDKILQVIMGSIYPILHLDFSLNDDEEEKIEKKISKATLRGNPGVTTKNSGQGEFTLTTYPEPTEDETLYLLGMCDNGGEFNLTGFREFLRDGATEYCNTTRQHIEDFAIEHSVDLIHLFLAGYHGKQYNIVHPMRWLQQTFPFDADGRFNQSTPNEHYSIIRLAAWYAGQLSENDVDIVHTKLQKHNCTNIYDGFLKPTIIEKLATLKAYWEETHGRPGKTNAPKIATP